MNATKPIRWVWTFVGVEVAGLAVDALWHGRSHEDLEAASTAEMAAHLATVHLLLYAGVLGLLASAIWLLADRARQSVVGAAAPVMVAGAAVQTAGEAWHAYSHLVLRPNPAPELVGFVGLAAVVAALLTRRRHPMRSRSAGAP